jgi:hypothetical protein
MNIDQWFNPTHGLELEPDINFGSRNNENGILFYCVYIILLKERRELSVDEINRLVFLLEDLESYDKNGNRIRGLYDRGARESLTIPYDKRRTISHDNITAISSLSPDHAKDIYKYGLKHFFIYNNCKPRLRAPMNPSNWSIWSYNGGSKFFWMLFAWIYVINMLISCNKSPKETSSKQLYFVELYNVKESNLFWKLCWKYYKRKMTKQYGEFWLHEIAKIYYQHPEHPNRILSEGMRF